jgi:hypothetical protein
MRTPLEHPILFLLGIVIVAGFVRTIRFRANLHRREDQVVIKAAPMWPNEELGKAALIAYAILLNMLADGLSFLVGVALLAMTLVVLRLTPRDLVATSDYVVHNNHTYFWARVRQVSCYRSTVEVQEEGSRWRAASFRRQLAGPEEWAKLRSLISSSVEVTELDPVADPAELPST